MINKTDKAYQDLLKRILDEGKLRGDRTGTGTISIFSHTIEMDMADGFPLLTTKKMFTKGIIHELLWFLNGDTNIKYLVDNGVNIWTSDAYREYCNQFNIGVNFDSEEVAKGHEDQCWGYPLLENTSKEYKRGQINAFLEGKADKPFFYLTIDEFTDKIKTDDVFAKKFGELGPVYGNQWRNWKKYNYVRTEAIFDDISTLRAPFGVYSSENLYSYKTIDQIQQLIDKLNNNPEDRRIMVSAWNVGEIDKMALPPCHWSFECYTEELTFAERRDLAVDYALKNNKLPLAIDAHGRDGIPRYMDVIDNTGWDIPKRRISLKWHQRSVDTFLGLPFNIASYGFLLHMLAQQTNMVAGKLIGDLTNVHIYKNHVDQCKEQISRTPMKLPTLILNKPKDIFSYSYDDFKINNYMSHESIKGQISV